MAPPPLPVRHPNGRADALPCRIVALLALAALTIYGGFFDRSIRPDPFSVSPGFFDWLLNNQPHPALKRMPVVPIGWRGTLAIRPSDTRWINAPWLPGAQNMLPAAGEIRPAAAASLPLVAPAQAGMSPEQGQQYT